MDASDSSSHVALVDEISRTHMNWFNFLLGAYR